MHTLTARLDPTLLWTFTGIVATLVVATLVAAVLGARATSESGKATLQNARERIKAWWLIAGVVAGAIALGDVGCVLLFALISFLALREFVALLPTTRSDHKTLLWSFFIITPLQYLFVARGWYGLYSIFIPVYVFLLVPILLILRGRGDTSRFLDRAAEIQWALLICVYCVSYAPALLQLHAHIAHQGIKLLLFLIIVVQISDVLQYVWGKLLGKHPLAPLVSPNKTWEGFLGGVLCATLIGAALWRLTPYTPLFAAAVSLAIALMGVAGGLTMSAIKRDRGVKDFGALLPGHGGMLDRIDGMCFAAPILFHMTRFFYG